MPLIMLQLSMENFENIVKELINRIEVLESKIALLVEDKTTKIISRPVVEDKLVRDKTKYMFEGKVYSKNKLVLAIVNTYVAKNPQIDYAQLSKVFDKSLQGSLGVIRPLSEALDRADADKRFFTNNIISLTSGEKVVVCTQWGAFNIDRFILRATSLGFDITQI